MNKVLSKSIRSNLSLKHRNISLLQSGSKFSSLSHSTSNNQYDAIIIGGGHNGLVCSNYLALQNKKVLVLERRHLVGGAAISEEIFPGYIFSRASYVLSLLR